VFDIYVVRIVHAVILSYHFLQQERMDDILEEHRKEMRHLKRKYLNDNRELARKNRAMCDELSSYKVSMRTQPRQFSINCPVVIASSE
jgi:hypothetical protein